MRIIDKSMSRQAAAAAAAEPEAEVVPVAPLPVLRLRRMGASDALVAHLGAMWAGMDDDAAEAAASAMADLSDRDLLVALVGEPDADQDPDAWADASPFPADAARVVALSR